MRRLVPFAIAASIVVAFLLTLAFLVYKSREDPVVYQTEPPTVTDIVKKTVATGAIVPRNEVAIKSRVSGVVGDLPVEPGELIAEGALIAAIRVIPDVASLNDATSSVRSAQINLDSAAAELRRAEDLFDRGAVSAAELDQARVTHQLREQEFRAATSHLQIVREGAVRGQGNVNTEVRSTVAGMVLSVDVKEGQSVIEANTFNEGTTIALVADMGDMIFEGTVDESEVGKISEGMALTITVGAITGEAFDGTLEYISPKGTVVDGVVQFPIKAAVQLEPGVFVRAGSSANADIVLDRREGVLAVRESVLQFERDGVYVEVETAPQSFERRKVEVGLSDGIHIEVLSGVGAGDKLKQGT